MIQKWETISKTFKDNLKIFNVELVNRKHPDLNKTGEFVVLDSPDWVNIIPITDDKKIVFVKQYRHGTDDITLEVPGGLIEKGEDPRKAAERECIEETGYTGPDLPILIGKNSPNPAFQTNSCYSYVWFNCKNTFEQTLDMNEDIETVELRFDEVKQFILQGKINHSIVLTALFFYSLKYGL